MTELLPDGLAVPDACPAVPAWKPPPPPPRRVWVLVAFALVVRLLACITDPVLPRDGVALAEAVQAVAEGSMEPMRGGPLHPLAVVTAAPPAALGLPADLALALVAALATSLAVLPLFLLVRRITGKDDEATAAGLLFAVTPLFVRVGSTALAEGLLLATTLASLHFTARAMRHFHPARDGALAGLFAGAAWLARPEGIVLLPLAALAVLPANGGRPLRGRLLALLGVLGAAALVASPWILLRWTSGEPFGPFAGKSVAVLAGGATAAPPGGAATGLAGGPLPALGRALGAVVEALHPAVAVLAGLGLLVTARLPKCGKTLGPVVLLLAAAAAFTAGLAVLEWRYGYGGKRHAAAAAVVLLPFAGIGFHGAARGLQRTGGAMSRPAVALGVMTFGLAGPLLVQSLLQRNNGGADARELGLRLRREDGPPPRIATLGEPRIAWYAGGVDIRLLREFGVPAGADDTETRRRGDALTGFLGGEAAPDWVVLREGDRRVPGGAVPARPPDLQVNDLRAWRIPRRQ